MTAAAPTTRALERQPIQFLSAKGGQGTSVFSVAYATHLCHLYARPVALRVTDLAAAQAILGASNTRGLAVNGLQVDELHAPTANDLAVYDVGTAWPCAAARAERRVLIVRNCYLSLSAAVNRGPLVDGAVLVAEPERAISAEDVEEALGVPVLAVVPVDPTIARWVDAGIGTSSIPPALTAAASELYANLDGPELATPGVEVGFDLGI